MDNDTSNPPIRHIPGHWISGKNVGRIGVLVDFAAGLIYARGSDGTLTMGQPDEFAAASGESGEDLLNAAMPWPSWRNLFHGAVREALAAVHSVAKIGIQDTNAWERPLRYVVDNNEGDAGLIEFSVDGAVAATSCHDPNRPFDSAEAIECAPLNLQDTIRRLCDAPLLRSAPGVSAVFWTEGEFVQGPEPWPRIYKFGAELFRNELLPHTAWQTEGALQYALTPELTDLVIAIANRATIRTPVVHVTERELDALIASGSLYAAEARALLLSDGIFEIASSKTH